MRDFARLVESWVWAMRMVRAERLQIPVEEDNRMPQFNLIKEVEFETVLKDIAYQFGVPGNLALARTILKMQVTINTLEANQKLMQVRIAELEGAQELP